MGPSVLTFASLVAVASWVIVICNWVEMLDTSRYTFWKHTIQLAYAVAFGSMVVAIEYGFMTKMRGP